MILPNDTVVAVADGHKMRLFRNKGTEPNIRLVGLTDPAIRPVNQGSGGRHRSSSANPDTPRLDEDDFAAAAAEYLNRKVLEGAISKLYLIADPRTLGEMRRHFHDSITHKLAGELAKDLTGRSVEDIERALANA